MALDTTIAGENADSYISLSEAESYVLLRQGFDSEWWGDLTDAQKEYYLKTACMLLDYFPFIGVPACKEQALAFPRIVPTSDLFNDEEFLEAPFDTWEEVQEWADYYDISDPAIPDNIKYAQVELVFFVVRYSETSTGSNIDTNIDSVKIGSKISFTFSDKSTIDDPLEIIKSDALSRFKMLIGKWLSRINGVLV